jgi:hypothetical protein
MLSGSCEVLTIDRNVALKIPLDVIRLFLTVSIFSAGNVASTKRLHFLKNGPN